MHSIGSIEVPRMVKCVQKWALVDLEVESDLLQIAGSDRVKRQVIENAKARNKAARGGGITIE